MTFEVRNQKGLEQLCFQVPLPAHIDIWTWNVPIVLSARHVPFICHQGVETLEICCKITFLNSSQVHSNGSSAENLFNESLSKSTSIKRLYLSNAEARDLLLYSLYRKPIFNSLENLSLDYPVSNHKKMLLFAKAVEFSPHLRILRLYGMELTSEEPSTIITTANVLCLLYQHQNLKMRLSSTSTKGLFLSTLRVGLLHKALTEKNCEGPENFFFGLDGSFRIKQILAQVARRGKNRVFHFPTKHLLLLTKTHREYMSSEKISSSVKWGAFFSTFTLN